MTFRAEPRRGAHPRGPDHLPRPPRRRRARCRGGSSSRRWSSSSSSGAEELRGRARRRAAPGDVTDPAARPARPREPSSRRGRAGRPRRPAAPGARPRAGHRGLPRRAARRVRRRPARRRIVRVPAASRPRRPDDAASTNLDVVGRRLLPPTRLLRSAAHDRRPVPAPRGASLGAAWRADRGGAAGAVYHTAGGGPLPIASRPADRRDPPRPRAVGAAGGLPAHRRRALRAAAARPAAARRGRGHRRDRCRRATRPAACSTSAGTGSGSSRCAAPRRMPVGPERRSTRRSRETRRLARAPRPGRALSRLPGPLRRPPGPRHPPARARRLAAAGRPADLPAEVAVAAARSCSLGASPDDRAALARVAARQGVGERLAYAPALPDDRLAALVRGARAAILPVLSEAAGLAAIEALACGTPSSRPRSARCRRSSGRPASSSSRATRNGWRPRCSASGPTPVHGRIAAAAMARARAPTDVGRRRRRDAARLRGGRAPPPDAGSCRPASRRQRRWSALLAGRGGSGPCRP